VRTRVGTVARWTGYRRVAYLIFGKSFRTFQGAVQLASHGYGADGLGLSASLFENLVDLAYIGRRRRALAAAYVDFEQVDKYCAAVKVLGHKRLPRGQRSFYDKQRRDLQAQAQPVLASSHQNRCPRNGWSGKGLRQRAEQVSKSLAAEYDMLYHSLCSYKHTTPAGAHAFVLTHAGGADVIAGPHINGVYSAALVAAELFLRLCIAVQRSFGLRAEDVRTYWEKLQTVARAVKSSHPESCE